MTEEVEKGINSHDSGLYILVPTHDAEGRAVSVDVYWSLDVDPNTFAVPPIGYCRMWIQGHRSRREEAVAEAQRILEAGDLDREALRVDLGP